MGRMGCILHLAKKAIDFKFLHIFAIPHEEKHCQMLERLFFDIPPPYKHTVVRVW